MSADSGRHFFKQAGWLVAANLGCGVFMFAVHPIVSKMDPAEYGVFATLLKVFLLLGVPAAGLQAVFALQTATAKEATAQAELAATLRAVLRGTFALWLVVLSAGLVFSDAICTTLKISNPAALWATLGLGLTSLWLPVMRGALQGRQDFARFGWTLMIDGIGRFSAVLVLVILLHGQAASAMSASLFSQLAAVALAWHATRELRAVAGGTFAWRSWLARVLPLTLGMGAVVFISTADAVFVQSQFPKEITALYQAGVIVGFGLSQFTLPIASVMFPKIAGGAGGGQDAALRHTLLGTAALGGAVAAVCSLVPTLPLRIVYFSNLEYYLQAAPLVPWFAWSILFLVMANVLVQNLLARERFAIVPWLVLIAAGFAGGLWWIQPKLGGMEPMAAFRLVVQVLGVSCLALLGTAVWFTWGSSKFKVQSSKSVP
ncbi:MAG: Uncharacterized protein FD161_4104 [Limisphaerales bacterium]|nr:MAG: Uncharacterized protein FD161_4104 [Limisphaerales bacterium]KAG0507182.1 MAG: Uncharacterized protein E1N63_3656 [Limisphaerales bacterium]TXT46979.1 MAG: Uncharacterized protein FD140_4334 [Limisphaerales bacterium]